MWNKQSAKKILERKQKTYQQSKHLQNLIKSRSTIDFSSPWKKSSILSSDRSKKSSYEKYKINYENRILLTHISKINDKEEKYFPKDNKFILLSQSLSNIVCQNRIRNIRNINKQNQNIYNRLTSTSPSIKKQHWQKSMQSQIKYRNNILRNRMRNPDYTILASSLLSKKYKQQIMKSNQSITLQKRGSNDNLFKRSKYL